MPCASAAQVSCACGTFVIGGKVIDMIIGRPDATGPDMAANDRLPGPCTGAAGVVNFWQDRGIRSFTASRMALLMNAAHGIGAVRANGPNCIPGGGAVSGPPGRPSRLHTPGASCVWPSAAPHPLHYRRAHGRRHNRRCRRSARAARPGTAPTSTSSSRSARTLCLTACWSTRGSPPAPWRRTTPTTTHSSRTTGARPFSR